MNLLLLLWLPAIAFSISPDCSSEINEKCQEAIKNKNEILKTIVNSRFPPLKSAFEMYNEKCDTLMDCAKNLECLRNDSKTSIFNALCEDVGTRTYYFDHECMPKMLRGVYKEENDCIKLSLARNFSMTIEVFQRGKSCFLQIAQEVCNPNSVEFLRENYDELMKMYTEKSTNDEDSYRLCTNPSDKFHKMQCEEMGVGLQHKFSKIPVINGSDADVREGIDMCRRAENCYNNSCLTEESAKIETKKVCDGLKMLPANLTKIYKQRPRLLEYQCLRKTSYYDLYTSIMRCQRTIQKENCLMTVISQLCQKEVMADFESLNFPMNCV